MGRLEQELLELFNDLVELEEEVSKDLNKAAHYWKTKDPAKYKKMLAKLRRDRKTSGHKEEAAQKVQQARRRERGGKGTTAGQGRKGHASGHMKGSTGSAVKRLQNAEKKAGRRLSLDRKNNGRGYESSNVRYVPDKLNNGDENRKDKKKWLKNHKSR